MILVGARAGTLSRNPSINASDCRLSRSREIVATASVRPPRL